MKIVSTTIVGRSSRTVQRGVRSASGWWNTPGWERCTGCSGSYNLEVEIRCGICDSPLCPLCADEAPQAVGFLCLRCAEGVH
jgi:hypothetical protein